MEKIIALTIGTFYLIAIYSVGGTGVCITLFMLLSVPVACICFGDIIGSYRGLRNRGYITKELLRLLIKLIGWALLLLPGVMVIISIATMNQA